MRSVAVHGVTMGSSVAQWHAVQTWIVRVLELGAARGEGVGLCDDLDAEIGERAAGRVGVSRRLPLELERLQLLVEALVLEVVAL